VSAVNPEEPQAEPEAQPADQRIVARTARDGFFVKGGKGKAKGTQNAMTLALKEFTSAVLQKHWHVVDEFMTSPDQRIRLDAFKFLFQYRWGMPTQRLELDLAQTARMIAERRGVPVEIVLAKVSKLYEEAVGKTEAE
jgi:hypothetical protein